MLVLQRKKGQGIIIGDGIKISIVEINSDGVKIAIEAPKNIKILREELVEATKVNQEAVITNEEMLKLKSIMGKTFIKDNDE